MSTLEERLKDVWEKYYALGSSLSALREQARQFNAKASPLGIESVTINQPPAQQMERLRDIELLLVIRRHFDNA